VGGEEVSRYPVPADFPFARNRQGVKELKRLEAQERNALTPPERTRQYRLTIAAVEAQLSPKR
jgi:hypothetical protein